MTIREEVVSVTGADEFIFDAFVTYADGESKGGLVILHEIFGVTEQLKSVARCYAEGGFDVIVPALFDRVSPQTVVPFDDHDAGRALMNQLDIENVLIDIDAARDHIDQGNGASVLGFSLGGGLAMKAATTLSLKSAVSYYGAKLPAFLDAPPKCPMQFHFGDADAMNALEAIDNLQNALPGADTHIYAAGHSFANDALDAYVSDAALPALERSVSFLNMHHS